MPVYLGNADLYATRHPLFAMNRGCIKFEKMFMSLCNRIRRF